MEFPTTKDRENVAGGVGECLRGAGDAHGKMQNGELLVFPTTLGGKTCLNVAEVSPVQLIRLAGKGWTSQMFNEYLILHYQITGDVLTVQWIDNEMKKTVPQDNKILAPIVLTVPPVVSALVSGYRRLGEFVALVLLTTVLTLEVTIVVNKVTGVSTGLLEPIIDRWIAGFLAAVLTVRLATGGKRVPQGKGDDTTE